jgi:hypothetical protein
MSPESALAVFFPRLGLPATSVEGISQGECWTFPVGPCHVYVYSLGSTLLLSATLGQAPAIRAETFYQRLLALNAEAGLLSARVGVEPDGAIKLTQVALLGREALEFDAFRANLEGFMRGMRVAGEEIVAGLNDIRAGLETPTPPAEE